MRSTCLTDRFRPLLALLAAALIVAPARSDDASFDAPALEFFEKQIRPILVERCYECHSGQADEPKGGLRVDSRTAILAGGDSGPAIEPGRARESLLIDAVNYGDIYQMPPKTKMPAEEIALLTKWVEMGAPWPPEQVTAAVKDTFDIDARKAEHWCWQPPVRQPRPKVAGGDWPRQSLDYFILARLEAAGLRPAPPAEKRTLIRRAYFDLIGLPPTPAEVDAFLQDESPQAYEHLVDRLLDSPHFGERWARHWLDLVRYAETYGHEFDYPIPNAYRYRDYVIRAFNADVPYDQFAIEHLAGDLLPDPRRHPAEGYNESVIGTAFWWLGEATHAPVDVRGDEANRIDNQLDTMTKTFMGITVACARCHDHKFDAISTKDYYALAGFLQSSRRHETHLVPLDRARELNERIETAKAELDRIGQAAVPLANEAAAADFASYLLAAREVLNNDIAVDEFASQRQLDAARLAAWIEALQDEQIQQPAHPLRTWFELVKTDAFDSARLEAARRQLAEAAARDADRDATFPLLADFQSEFAPWRVEGDAFGTSPTRLGEFERDSQLPVPSQPGVADSGRWSAGHRGVLRSPAFTLEHGNIFYRVKGKDVRIRLVVDGYFMDVYNKLLFNGFTLEVKSPDEFTWIRQAGDIGRYLGHRAYIEIIDNGDGEVAIDEIRFSDGPAPDWHANPIAESAAQGAAESTPEALAAAYGQVWRAALDAWHERTADAHQVELLRWAMRNELVATDKELHAQFQAAAGRLEQLAAQLPPSPSVLAMTDGSSLNERVHVRGNHRLLGEEVPRGMLEAIRREEPAPPDFGSGRLELARQVVDPQNPLTARVMVNRVWHHLFGRGIVASTDNFGVLGDRPTHPELLDQLAIQFVDDGWSLKQLLRTIMLSGTYQMSSTPRPEADERDPQLLLLHRMPIRRLEGEAIRDAMLKVSGRLDPTLFGSGVPVHITPFMQGRGRPGSSGPLDGAGRRSIYIEVRRNFLPPMMLAFDTPIPFNTIGRRNVSNVPAQALILMNDPFAVEQAAKWAKRVLEENRGTTEERIERLYLDAFSRPPVEEETASAVAFLDQQARTLGIEAEQAASDERLWTDLCHVLFNVKEFVFLQ